MTWRWMCNCSVLNPAMCLLSGHIHITVPSHSYTEPLCFYCLPVTIHTPTNYALIPSTSTRHLLLRYPHAHILLLPFTVNGRMWKRGNNTNLTGMDTHCSLATNTHCRTLNHTLYYSLNLTCISDRCQCRDETRMAMCEPTWKPAKTLQCCWALSWLRKI